MTLLSLKQARGRPNRTFPNSRYTPGAFLLQIKANNCRFPWQDRVHTAGTAEKATGVTVRFRPLERVLGHYKSALVRPNVLLLLIVLIIMIIMMMMMMIGVTKM